MISVLAARAASNPIPLNNSSWWRNEDIWLEITIDDSTTTGNNNDLSGGVLKFVVKESTNPASPPLHEYSSEAAGGIKVTYKSADRITATLKIDKAHLASLSPTTDIVLEGQLIAVTGPELVYSILDVAKFTSKKPI
jgi:hypothetical protein